MHDRSLRRIIRTFQKQAAESAATAQRHVGEPTAYSYQMGLAKGLQEAAEVLDLWDRDQVYKPVDELDLYDLDPNRDGGGK